MNDRYILNKDHLLPFLRRIKKECRLVAPVKNRHGDTLLTEIEHLENNNLDLDNQAQGSAKSFLFPQQETLFTYSSPGPEQYDFKPVYNAEPTIYFGLRSCDLSAILYMDVIFQQNSKDPYYLRKRQNSILISVGCREPFANCFCNATKSGPFLDYGYDLQFTDLGDRYFVEVDRSKGQELVNRWGHFFAAATEDDKKAQYQIALEARGRFKQHVLVDKAIKRLQADDLPETLWRRLSGRCQDCSGCAYICPTCTCFTIRDQMISEQEGLRIRSWDACTTAGFTGMAGGHNPVDREKDVVRKRFLHKLLHDVQKHHRTSCVGCGRCVDMCFGGVDIIRFIDLVCELP